MPFDRATSSDQLRQTQTWIDARPHVDMNTTFDFASTNGTIGGNSSSQNRAAVDTSEILAPLKVRPPLP